MTERPTRTLRTRALGGAIELSVQKREECASELSRERLAAPETEEIALDVDACVKRWETRISYTSQQRELQAHTTLKAYERGEPVEPSAWRRTLTRLALLGGFSQYYWCLSLVRLSPEAFDFWLEVAAAAATSESSSHALEELVDLERWRAQPAPETDREANLEAVLTVVAEWARGRANGNGHPAGLLFTNAKRPSFLFNECARHLGLDRLIEICARVWDDERFVWWVIASLKRDASWEDYTRRRDAADRWMARSGATREVARGLSAHCQLRIASHLLDEELTKGLLDAGVQVPIWHIVHALRDAPRADVVDAISKTCAATPLDDPVSYGEDDYSKLGYDRPSMMSLALHLGADAPGLVAFLIERNLEGGNCYLTPTLLKMSSPLLVEHFHWILGRKALRAYWPQIKDYMEWEGAHAITGLVGMAERRGKRRTFALEHLQSYARRGHADLIEAALGGAPDKLAALIRDEVLSEQGRADALTHTETGAESFQTASASSPTLDLADAPEWLTDILALPEGFSLDPRLEQIVWPAVRLAGSDVLLGPDKLAAIARALQAHWGGATQAHDLDEDAHAAHQRSKAALDALPSALDPEGADALWGVLFHHAPSDWSMWSLHWLGGPMAFERAGQLLRRDAHVDRLDPAELWEGTISSALLACGDVRAWAHVLSMKRLGRATTDYRHIDTVKRVLRGLEERLGWDARRAYANLAPSLGLEGDGAARFDYGGRVVTMGLDASLQIVISDDTGKVYASLPGARKGEDRARVALHKKRMKWMRAILERALEDAKARFEDELRDMYPRALGELREYVLAHPWRQFFVRSLIWGCYRGLELEQTFLCDADGSLVDADFDTLDLPDDAIVRLVHPCELSKDERLAWSQALADSEIVQPFPQLQREVLTAADWDDEIGRFAASSSGAMEAVSKRLRAQPRWKVRSTHHATRYGNIWYVERRFDEHGLRARLLFDSRQWDFAIEGEFEKTPGLYVFASASSTDPSDFTSVRHVPPSEVPPRVASELLLELRG